MADEWQRARLIPVAGSGSRRENEQRATSALLAVLSIVRPLSASLLSPLGAPRAVRATVETFLEPSFTTSSGATGRPDGLVRITSGTKAPFVTLVEVKTGTNKLDPISIVYKVASVSSDFGGQEISAVKLSDNYEKAGGSPEEIAVYRAVFGTEGVSNAPVIV